MRHTLDCGCILDERGRHWCPTCAGGGLPLRADDAGALAWRALNRLLRECEWTRAGDGWHVVSRTGDDSSVGKLLRQAEAAHGAYVDAHGGQP